MLKIGQIGRWVLQRNRQKRNQSVSMRDCLKRGRGDLKNFGSLHAKGEKMAKDGERNYGFG